MNLDREGKGPYFDFIASGTEAFNLPYDTPLTPYSSTGKILSFEDLTNIGLMKMFA